MGRSSIHFAVLAVSMAFVCGLMVCEASPIPYRYRSDVGAAGTGAGGTGTGTGTVGADGLEPFRIDRINRGLSTILNGVRSFSLQEILRGSFMFTRNGNVRSVADNVISSVFGTPVRGEGGIGAGGAGTGAGAGADASAINPNDVRIGSATANSNSASSRLG